MKLPEVLLKDIHKAVDQIEQTRSRISDERSLLVAISGIDGSGKGVISNEILKVLKTRYLNIALIGLDAWHHPQNIRFNRDNPAQHFYDNAFRWQELFNSLILPLKQNQSIDLQAKSLDLKTDRFYDSTYDFKDIDIILFEGIFIFKKPWMDEYDLKIWVDCNFDTALNRALSRGQEGLGKEETIRDYQTIYFPAQRIHFERDNPTASASLIIHNDLMN
ncbi:MAG: uridine kinase [Roseofilum sp. SBFL]|uniref:uridine kinase family protein n=1 Tax=unclassified Roseofilum TaxID=2620099 RepID=UPI001B0375C5|nr:MULTISPECIES: hypothetical protein [unclassified Roseofilum]MBP0014056.1 uridine kinase [Roseofilum sp. SID3]MBP0026681.1 uridine kinase [Roseofilum sp. SID2]MBP0038570.1 uridine kinase [Roseofilum sp. SID1]MBP0040811.1 uridine kinase [Roseofilum sp. SBFL]